MSSFEWQAANFDRIILSKVMAKKRKFRNFANFSKSRQRISAPCWLRMSDWAKNWFVSSEQYMESIPGGFFARGSILKIGSAESAPPLRGVRLK